MPASLISNGVREDDAAAALELVHGMFGFARRRAGVFARRASLSDQFAVSAAADRAERI